MQNLKSKINIIDFCQDPQLLNLKLIDTQEVLLRAIYNLPMTREQLYLFRTTFGEPAPRTSKAHDEVILVLGRGSGKSTLTAAITCYEACLTDWGKYLRPGEVANIFVFATKLEQAVDVGRNMIFSMIEMSPILSTLIDTGKENDLRFLPKTKAGTMVLKNKAAISAMPCMARVGRGYPIAIIIMDEAAWYARESKNDSTDDGIYNALFPRLFQFKEDAKTFIISSPADKSGLVWDRYSKREKRRKLYFCVKAPMWKMRTDLTKEEFKKFVEKYKILSPLGYQREMGAEFSSTRDPLLDRTSIERCCRKEVNPIPLEPKKEHSYIAAFDAAFGDNDRFGIAVGHSEVNKEEGTTKIVIDLCEILVSSPGEDFVTYAASKVADIYKKYDLFEIFCDQYQADSFSNILENHGCNTTMQAWTAATHRIKYGRLKNFIKRKLVEFPNYDELVEELNGLQVKFLPSSGQYTIEHQVNGHDDLADAIAEVVYRLSEDLQSPSGVVAADGVNISI